MSLPVKTHDDFVLAADSAYARTYQRNMQSKRGTMAPKTIAAISTGKRAFARWAAETGIDLIIPHCPTIVADFVDDLVRTKSAATVASFVWAIDFLHEAAGAEKPGTVGEVRDALKRMRRAEAD